MGGGNSFQERLSMVFNSFQGKVCEECTDVVLRPARVLFGSRPIPKAKASLGTFCFVNAKLSPNTRFKDRQPCVAEMVRAPLPRWGGQMSPHDKKINVIPTNPDTCKEWMGGLAGGWSDKWGKGCRPLSVLRLHFS